MEKSKEKYLEDIYLDPSHSAAFGGIDVLFQFVKEDKKFNFTKEEIINFLQSQPTYTSRVRKSRPSRYPRFTVPGPRHLIQVDTAYMPKSGHKRYIVGAIDTFSRKIKAKAVSNIKAKTVSPIVMELIKELGGTRYLNSDLGTEYSNSTLRDELEKEKINHYFATKRSKAHFMERAWRSLKSHLAKATEAAGTKSWDKLLPDVIEAYNSRPHRSLYGASPNKVSSDPSLAAEIWFKAREEVLKQQVKEIPYQYNINDGVRMKLESKNTFQKESSIQNSPRVYFIASRRKVDGIPLYTLKTELNDALTSSFAHDQLQKVILSSKSQYKIEQIISYKDIDGVPHAKVKWLGYDPSYNTFIPKSELKGYFASNPKFQLQKESDREGDQTGTKE